MKMRKIGRILTVMFLTGGLMTGCQKKQTVVLPEKEQKEEATETESKNKETQEISFDEELPKDYEGTLTMWGWDTDYYQTVRLSEVCEYLHPHMVNSKGNVCGIEQSLSPAGLAYRRDLAKKYLGTDDPEELEEMMPTWEAFIQKGKEVYEKSNGEVYMWFSLEDIRQFTQEQSDTAWVSDGKIDVKNVFDRSISLATRFRDEHISDNLIAWTPAWNEALREDEHIFTACATWSVKFSIESSDPQQKNLGRWGLMSAPEGNANWGGTSMGITKTCKDKRLAWEFLKFATLSTEGARTLNSMGLMTTAKKPYEEDPSLKSYKSRWFGNQDLGIYYMDHIIPNIKTRALTPQDGMIHDSLSLVLNALNQDENLSAEEAEELLREELQKELKDITVY